MSVSRFEIYFNNPHATYISGQHVTGRVTIELLKEKKIRAIEIHFLGDAEVKFKNRVNDTETEELRTHHYSAGETYFAKTDYAVGGPNTEITLQPGIHNYPFDLTLPTNIPSSFEEKYGRIRYIVKAAICRPWKFDHKCKAAFTVLDILDLNSRPDLLNPVRTTTEWNFCWGCCGSAISVTVSLPFAGYVPGQRCQAVVEVDNPTENHIAVQSYLLQIVTFTSSDGTRKVGRKIVSRKQIGEITLGGSKTSSVSLQIPVLTNSSLGKCRYIDISYYFEIIGGSTGSDYRTSVPIVIGSIPFITQFANITSPQRAPVIDTDSAVLHSVEAGAQRISSTVRATASPFPSYPEMPPPSYDECVSGKTNIRSEEDNEYVQGVMDFTPRYPVYSFKEYNS